MIPARLTVVTLAARDLPALRRFYRGLGWPEVAGSDDAWCAFVLGGVVLALYPQGALDDEAGAAGGGPGGFTLALNVDTPDEVDAVHAAAVVAGAGALGPPTQRAWGGRSGYWADPEGNRWEVAWAPGLVLGARGEVVAFGS
ncbi:MAG TPA: VOC family protein [Acidimicrobiales bacterium]|nr:VOC family protein [Acidimicrobiales bacterium]